MRSSKITRQAKDGSEPAEDQVDAAPDLRLLKVKSPTTANCSGTGADLALHVLLLHEDQAG